jgi:hypothetical protein
MYELITKQGTSVLDQEEQTELNTLVELDKTPEEYDTEEDEEVE